MQVQVWFGSLSENVWRIDSRLKDEYMTYYSADYDGTPGDVELRGGMEILKDLNNLKKHLEGSRCLIGIIEKIAAQQKAAASKGKHSQQICVANSAEKLVQGYKAAKLCTLPGMMKVFLRSCR